MHPIQITGHEGSNPFPLFTTGSNGQDANLSESNLYISTIFTRDSPRPPRLAYPHA